MLAVVVAVEEEESLCDAGDEGWKDEMDDPACTTRTQTMKAAGKTRATMRTNGPALKLPQGKGMTLWRVLVEVVGLKATKP